MLLFGVARKKLEERVGKTVISKGRHGIGTKN